MHARKIYPVILLIIFVLLVSSSLSAHSQPPGSAQPAQPQAVDTSFETPVYFKASNPQAWDKFGTCVAVSGNTLVVGAPGEDSAATTVNGDQTDNSASFAGAAYVFYYNGTNWEQQAYLKASNAEMDDLFGNTVAISGDTIAVGANGEDSNGSGGQGDNSAAFSGAVYVFTRSGSTWSQQAYLKASNAGANDEFGSSLAISGDTIVVGAYYEDSNGTGGQSDNSAFDAGAAYVFTRIESTWIQQAYLKASNAEAYDWFGASVGIYGDMALVGAPWEDSDANGLDGNQNDNTAGAAGAAYAFYRSSGSWSQVRYIKASNSDAGDLFGQSVSIAYLGAVIGASDEDSSARVVNGDQTDNSSVNSGAAYLFEHIGSVFAPQVAYLKASNADAFDNFGWSVAVNDWEEVLVSAYNEASSATGVDGNQLGNSAVGAGAAYDFDWVPNVGLKQLHYLKASNTEAQDAFGISLAATTDWVVVGAPREASGASGLNGNQEDNSADYAGAVYIPGGIWRYNFLPLVLR